MRITQTDLPMKTIDDSKYQLASKPYNGRWFQMEKLYSFKLTDITLKDIQRLNENKANLQSPVYAKEKLLKYLEEQEEREKEILNRAEETDWEEDVRFEVLSSEEWERAQQVGISVPEEHISSSKYYSRNEEIARLAKKRAGGVCQLCGKTPFCYADDEVYLEAHHIIFLSKGGSDTLENTAALCPNCHKKMHIVRDAADIKILLKLAKKPV